MKLLLIRHGMTKGNEKKRYIGITDEELSEQGKAQVCALRQQLLLDGILESSMGKTYIVVSPMKRCKQTAEELNLWNPRESSGYHYMAVVEEKRLRECNFGLFENKNYLELKDEPWYQKWIDSNGTMDFPEGDNLQQWKKGCIQAFDFHVKKAEEQNCDQIVFVIHGGSIMAVMEYYDEEKKGYYDYHVNNADGYYGDIIHMRICNKRTILS